MKIVFATNNAHKLEEARRIAGDRLEILSLSDIGCHDDIPETSDTLSGNALLKARWIKKHYGHDAIADDTGLFVDALDGAPGVHTARYAGEACDPQANMALLLKNMEGERNRRASFRTVIAYVSDLGEETYNGRVDGTIGLEPIGTNGFGYDPVFIPDETGRPFACMEESEKNRISHRGRALRAFIDSL